MSRSSYRSPTTSAAGPAVKFARMAEELKRQFNGVTIYDRKPATGETHDSSDDTIIFEAEIDIYRQHDCEFCTERDRI